MADHLKAAVIAEIARTMVAAGEDFEARKAAALKAFPGCPTSILHEADLEADRLVEEAFLRPLEPRFSDQVAERQREADADRERRFPGYGERAPYSGRASSSHLDLDIPF